MWHGTKISVLHDSKTAQKYGTVGTLSNVSGYVSEGCFIAAGGITAVKSIGKAVAGTAVKGGTSVVGTKITGFTKHGINQAIQRGVTPDRILGTLRNPVKIVHQSGGRIKYIGQKATVVVNKVGKVITTWPK